MYKPIVKRTNSKTSKRAKLTVVPTKPDTAGGRGDVGEALGLPPGPREDCGLHRREGRCRRSFGAAARTWGRLWTSSEGGEMQEKLWGCRQDLEKTVDFHTMPDMAGGSGHAGKSLGLPPAPRENCGLHRREGRCRRSFGAASGTWRRLWTSAGRADYRSDCVTDDLNAEDR